MPSTIDVANASLEAAKAGFLAATRELNVAKSGYEAAKATLDVAISNAAELKVKNSELEKQLDKCCKEKTRVSELNASLETKVSKLEKNNRELEDKLRQSDAEFQRLNNKLQEWEKQKHMIPAKRLGIEWGNTPQYWIWKSSPDSMYGEVAELLGVTWLAISGRLGTSQLAPNKIYAAYLVNKLTDKHEGFSGRPAEASVGIVGGAKSSSTSVFLVASEQGPHPMRRQDGWMEVVLGQYFVTGNVGELEIWFSEVSDGFWKRGLVVLGIEVRAK